MSTPDDPFGVPQRSAPADAPADAPGPRATAGRNRPAVAALVVGVLAVVLGLTIIGGLVLGSVAMALGLVGRARARTVGRGGALAVAGVVLGALGVVLALAAYLYVRDEVARFQDCGRASVSIVEDERCRAELERELGIGQG